VHLALPKAQFWNLKFTKPKPPCNLGATHGAPNPVRQWSHAFNLLHAILGVTKRVLVAKADALCRPRIAIVPDQAMGSVDASFLGSKDSMNGGLHGAGNGRTLIGVAIISVVEITAASGTSAAHRARGNRRT
jgi:hypothetical protein